MMTRADADGGATPRNEQVFAVFGFESTHDALAGETLLEEASIAVVPVPTPRSLGVHCGIALRVPRSQETEAIACLERGGVVPAGIIRMDDV